MIQDWVDYDLERLKQVYDGLEKGYRISDVNFEGFLEIVAERVGNTPWEISLSKIITDHTHNYAIGSGCNFDGTQLVKSDKPIDDKQYTSFREIVIEGLVIKIINDKVNNVVHSGRLDDPRELAGYILRAELGEEVNLHHPFER